MDYTKLPRELIYYDRLSIDEFNVDDRESFNGTHGVRTIV